MKVIEEATITASETEKYLRQSMQFEYCTFKNCDFTKNNLSGFSFLECDFQDCDLSGVQLIDTGMKEVRFFNCKLIGLHFDQCNQFLLSMSFTGCKLDYSSFFKLNLAKANFINSSCIDCDFVETNLSQANIDGCDLTGALFDRTNLEKADLSTSQNLILDPEKNNIQKAKLDRNQLSGLLTKYNLVIG